MAMAGWDAEALTALLTAHLAGVELEPIGLGRDRWEALGLAALGVDLDALAAALSGDAAALPAVVREVEETLGRAGRSGPLAGSPFDQVRLVRVAETSRSAAVAGAPPAPVRGPLADLDHLSAAVLSALEGSGLGAPGSADVPLVDYVRARGVDGGRTSRRVGGAFVGRR